MIRSLVLGLCAVVGVCSGAFGLTGSGDSPVGALSTTPPVFSGLVVSPAAAAAGETVTISFESSKSLDTDPTVTVNGNPAVVVSGVKTTSFSYTYVVDGSDALGAASISINGADPLGNFGALNDNSALEIIEPAAALPVRPWPFALTLLLTALAGLLLRRRSVAMPLALLLLAAPTALAQGPTVSNVAFTQQPTGSGTEVVITYDLDSPNGPSDITVSLSKDAGSDGFSFPVTSVTGDLTGVTTGTGKTITWDIAADYPNEDIPNAQLRVTADDGLVLYTLTYTAGPGGTISGDASQSVVEGNDGTAVTAVPDSGFAFVDWSDSSTDNPRTDTNVMADLNVTANFIQQFTLTYTAGPGGSISGTSPQTVNVGDDGTAVTAVPDSGFAFVDWTDGNTNATRTDTNVMADLSVTANFVEPPEVTSFELDGGAISTGDAAVTLDNTSSGAPVEYMASEASDFSGATWAPYGTGPSFTLSNDAGGTKTVYFKVRNAAGESAPVSDTIDWTEDIVLLPGNVPLEMVWIPAGTYQRGRYPGEQDSFSNEDPQHTVTLSSGFWLGKYEVTQAQWEAVTGSNPSFYSGANRPVDQVSWNTITGSYIPDLNTATGLSFRLPTEAEWEYAARAGTTTRFYWGDDLSASQIGDYAWYNGNSSSQTQDVGQKLPNAFGLYDMSGNVWEWCQDWFGSYPSGSVTDPTGPASGSNRVIRGGSWGNDAGICRSALRILNAPPSNADATVGFRLAR